MAIEFQTGLGGLGRRGREGRPPRGLRPAVWVERLEDKVLMAAAVTAFSIPPAGSISPMTQGADGNLWYERVTWSGGILNTRLSGRIGRVTPSGAVAEYPLPSGGYPATSLIAGPDGNLWFTSAANDASGNPTSAFVARVTPSGVISEYPLAAGVILTSDLVAGPDGNLWFAETIRTSSASALQGRIGRVTPSGVLTEYPLSPGEGPGDLIVGPDGNLWFLGTAPAASGLNLSGFVGRVTPSGVISKFAIPSVGYFTDLTVGSDGNLWFATTVDKNPSPQMRGRVSRVTLSGVVTEYILPSGGIATDLTAGPDGNLWFTETVYAASGPFLSSAIGRVTPSGVVSEYPLAGGGSALDLVVGPDGNLWFNETVYGDSGAEAGFIGRVTLSGVVAEYPLAAGHILPSELTIGPDGNLWFVGYVKAGDGTTSGLFVGRMSTSGAVSYESVSGLPPSGSAGLNFLNQSSLTIGADGNLWFTVTEQPRYSPTFSVPPTGVAIERVNVAAFPIPQLVSPTITGLLRTGIRAQPTRLVLSFDAALAVSSAEDLRNYVLVPSGPRGRVRPGIRPLAIRRAKYDAASDTVTLTLGRRLPIKRYYRITVRGTLTGANGAPLDGSGRGQPGSDYHALLYKSGPVEPSAARSVGPGRIKLRLTRAGDKSA